MEKLGRPAVFLDKDGTLVDDVAYNVDPGRIRLAPGAADALRLFTAAGVPVIVVTNQSGLARGLFSEEELAESLATLAAMCDGIGGHLEAIYCCPHHPRGIVPEYTVDCTCRKPGPAMLQVAAAERGIDLASSWMVGDILDDVAAGRAAGTRTLLLHTGHETEWAFTPERVPDLFAAGMFEAAELVLEAMAEERPDVVSADLVPMLAGARRVTAVPVDRAMQRIRQASEEYRGSAHEPLSPAALRSTLRRTAMPRAMIDLFAGRWDA